MKARLPQLWGVLYAGPNQDGQRKMCDNCEFFENGDCEVLGIGVKPDQICGYHVESGNYADPKEAGLETVEGGTSCDRCKFYAPTDKGSGMCLGTADENGRSPEVEAMGCCGRWEAGDEG